MQTLQSLITDLSGLFFPHICAGCGDDNISDDSVLCLKCILDLPITNFHLHSGNQVEKIFWGRLPLTHATSLCYFNTGSLIQTLLHQLKYNGKKDLGYFLGMVMGDLLSQSNRFTDIDALLPLPLFPAREKKRGYNQAAVLCDGISSKMHIPVLKNLVYRTQSTSTQTKKNRVERWQNMEGKFAVRDHAALCGKHILLVDDVITTGATLEACGQVLLEIPDLRLSIATLAYTIK